MTDYQPKSYTEIPDRLAAILSGALPLPNFEPQDPLKVLGPAIVAAQSFSIVTDGKVQRTFDQLLSFPAFYFLEATQAGHKTGEGYVIYSEADCNGRHLVAGRFAICKHERVIGPGANPNIGWYPARCSKCGLNLSVDSGD